MFKVWTFIRDIYYPWSECEFFKRKFHETLNIAIHSSLLPHGTPIEYSIWFRSSVSCSLLAVHCTANSNCDARQSMIGGYSTNIFEMTNYVWVRLFAIIKHLNSEYSHSPWNVSVDCCVYFFFLSRLDFIRFLCATFIWPWTFILFWYLIGIFSTHSHSPHFPYIKCMRCMC